MRRFLVVPLVLLAVAAGHAFAHDKCAGLPNFSPAQCSYVSAVPLAGAQSYTVLCCRTCIPGRISGLPQEQWLSPSQVTQKLALQGYQVDEIEVHGEAYEFEGTNSAGIRIEGLADPATGKAFPRGSMCCDPCREI